MEQQNFDKNVLVVMTQEQLREIYEKAAAIGAQEALKTFEQEKKALQG